MTEPSSRRMISGTATLITVASASVRKTPGASGEDDQPGVDGRAAGEGRA